MSGRDFFTLQRRIFAPDSWLWDMPAEQTKVAITLIGMANWKEGKTFSGGELVKVSRGQVMTSLDKLAAASRVSKQTVRTTLRNLERAEFLTCKSTNRFRIITILNYSREQSRELSEQHAAQQATGTPLTGQQQATGTPLTPIEPSNQETREPSNQETTLSRSSSDGESTQPDLILCNPTASTKITRAEFESVYKLYPKRTDKSKGLDKLESLEISQAEFERLQCCAEWMAKAWSGHDVQYCPGFMPFINGKRWNDEHWPKPRTHSKTQSGVVNPHEFMEGV